MKEKINKDYIVGKIYARLGLSKAISQNLTNDILNILIKWMKNSKNIKVTKFGTFKIFQKKERIGRNPKTKKTHIIKSGKVVTFSGSKILKRNLNINENN